MRKLATLCSVLLVAPMLSQAALAQDQPQSTEKTKAAPEPVHYYHLDFVVQELGADGKPVNSRSYTTTVSTDPSNGQVSIRTNSRIPVATSSTQSTNGAVENIQYQYIDVGVNIDCRHAHELGHELSIDITADVSSMGPALELRPHQPTIRQNKWQAIVLIPLGKPTVIFTSDDLDSKGSMQVVATATPIS